MAKKKKPAANPARGFATTSIASKPKPEKLNEADLAPPTESKDGKADAPDINVENSNTTITTDKAQEKEIHELTPEELEAQLERNELQMLVEKHGLKVRRDVSRFDSKLKTDGRVLRGQAQHVSIKKWLPQELMDEILDLIKKERQDASQLAKQQTYTKNLSEEDIVIRCWTLIETLHDFGISHEHVTKAIDELLKNPPGPESGPYVWGFKETLDYLCLDIDEKDLPAFDRTTSRKLLPNESTSAPDTGFNTPISLKVVTPEPSPHPKNRRHVPPPATFEEDVVEDDVNISDLDSDVDPSELVSSYLALKERMYRYKPELADTSQAKGRKSKGLIKGPPKPLQPNARKLRTRMRRIESDMLFDKFEAEDRWAIRRIQIAQEASSAQILEQLVMNDDQKKETKAVKAKVLQADLMLESTSNDDSQDSDANIIGDIFAHAEDDDLTNTDATGDQPIKLRDLGKLTGMSPRRILDDACRARDGRVTLTFRMVSPTTYLSRHSVKIQWSVDQERILAEAVPYIQIDQDPSPKGPELSSTMTFTMTSIANPDPKQSEAFVAAVALFYLLSTSPREDKQYLKLPANFRDIYLELAEHQKQNVDTVDREKLKAIRDLVHLHSQQKEDDGIIFAAAFRSRGLNSPRPGSSRGVSPSRAAQKGPSNELAQLWYAVQTSGNFQRMLVNRMTLPMFGFKEAALEVIQNSQVTILCGETGCGKSTQLPSYVLERELSQGRECKIYCTQPRRISAISLAQRVSEELGDNPGEVGTIRSLVGYAIRLESRISARTRLVYATVGVVLRMLESSKSLDDITHLIIDEVHERSIDTDFLLVILKSLMVHRPELKVVLMSATVDATRFSRYLNDAPIITVPGRTFPVQTRYLEDAIELTGFTNANTKSSKQEEDIDDQPETGDASGIPKQLQGYSPATRNALASYDEYRIDYELIIRLMEQIATDPMYAGYSKATLVFLPGIAEIRELNDMLGASPVFNDRCWVIPLHSSIASEEQQMAFQFPPSGVRKVVLATNIAETGITIPDVTCVIDTGKHKEMRYDERRQMSRLIQSFISRANAKQRRGRAGRVQEGLCFHLFTKYRHDELMAEQQTPEMLRLSLQDLIMRVKICGLGDIEATLAEALDPPLAKNVRRAIDALIEVGALTSTEELTTLGSQLARLPLDANLGKLCLLSGIFGCLDVGLTVAAILSSKSPFITPFGDRQRADTTRLGFAKSDSDLLTAYNAYCSWRRISQAPNQSVYAWCKKNYLSHQNLSNIEDLKAQLLNSLGETGLVAIDRKTMSSRSRYRQSFAQTPPEADINSSNEIITNSVIAWSFYPKLLIRDGKGWRNVANSQTVSLHPSSVNKHNHDLKFLSYYSMMASSGSKFYNALSTTSVLDLPLALMVGDADWKMHAGVCVIDGNRLRFRVEEWKVALVLKMVRKGLEEVVEGRLKEPNKGVTLRMRKWLNVWEGMCRSYAGDK